MTTTLDPTTTTPETPELTVFTMPAGAALRAIRALATVVAPPTNPRPALTGIAVQVTPDHRTVALVATDSYRLGRIVVDVEVGGPVRSLFLGPDLHRQVTRAFTRSAAARMADTDAPPVVLATDGRTTTLTVGGASFSERTVDPTFPEWERLFPEAGVAVPTDQEPVTFNPRYLAGLGTAATEWAGQRTVVVEVRALTSVGTPAHFVVRHPDGATFDYLLMPMRPGARY